MNFKIKEIKEKNIWEDFFLEIKEKTFLQSWYWGEFNEKMKNKIWRLGIFKEKLLTGTALVLKIKAKRGTFLLLQHAPSIKNSEQTLADKYQILSVLLEKLKKIAKEENCLFVRMNPLWENNRKNQEIFKKLGFRQSPMHASSYEATLKLDLSDSEENILKNMRKTTRYLIRKGKKNQEIIIKKSEKLKDIEKYQELNKKVAQRQKFVPFSFKHLENEFQVFSQKKSLLVFGEYKKETVAAALVIFWSGIAFYHQAASDSKYGNLSLPYLVLWEAIKEAKKRKCLLFDFWGYVNPKAFKKHPWAGPTLFKMGFGGKIYQHIETQDLPLSKKYWLTFSFEKLRKLKRGL